jgi:hypothetical protein
LILAWNTKEGMIFRAGQNATNIVAQKYFHSPVIPPHQMTVFNPRC